MVALDVVRLFTVEEFQKMAEMGLFQEEERLELIQGQVRPMSPIGVRHSRLVTKVGRLFFQLFGADYDVRIQDSVVLSADSQPQPDVAVTTRYEERDNIALPTPADTSLLIEVSDSTLPYDLSVKVPLYAGAGIPELWVIDLNANTVQQYLSPENGAYTRIATWRKGDTIVTTLGVSIAAEDVLL